MTNASTDERRVAGSSIAVTPISAISMSIVITGFPPESEAFASICR
jgi:hypothetical protein